ncbi:cytochrome bd-I ubiquinol oxidase subunit 2 apoprotein [Williamsia limnetica]|uniref:Cytochrome bd-I ubiquinol oxidase subunit 2 apoprotein n=1 Tax=Williamsia limnetica TaxID=882452 RepID=A0A318RSR5_WILLI|nr:cytochrome d ubiquinol oxidase subunit II [Williamsia limnetica]PYE18754.1 cytochrome bd-I ubiquinol oxidase subunit 2 apoprotein [Williamsia limnetica]
MSDIIAIVLMIGIIAYAVFGGADFGAGFWDLVAGGTEAGARPRELIDRSIGPVWEANHVWLIFSFVVLWTAFPQVYASITLTLFVPLTIAALGIVLRGASFAFRKAVLRTRDRRRFGAVFATSSVLVPYCLGAVIGAIASGQVPPGGKAGDSFASWMDPVSILGGVLAVVVAAYLAAVNLIADARRLGDDEMVEYFRRRAIGAAVVAGITLAAGVLILREYAPYLFDGLTSRALPLMILSGLCGVASLVLIVRRDTRFSQWLSGTAVVAALVAYGVAQTPYLLPETVTVTEAAAPSGTLGALLVATVAAGLIVLPSLGLLYVLDRKNLLPEEG